MTPNDRYRIEAITFLAVLNDTTPQIISDCLADHNSNEGLLVQRQYEATLNLCDVMFNAGRDHVLREFRHGKMPERGME